jgi:hypothetical protein
METFLFMQVPVATAMGNLYPVSQFKQLREWQQPKQPLEAPVTDSFTPSTATAQARSGVDFNKFFGHIVLTLSLISHLLTGCAKTAERVVIEETPRMEERSSQVATKVAPTITVQPRDTLPTDVDAARKEALNAIDFSNRIGNNGVLQPAVPQTSQSIPIDDSFITKAVATQIQTKGIGVLYLNSPVKDWLTKNNMSPIDVNTKLTTQQLIGIQNVVYCAGEGKNTLVLSGDGGQHGLTLNNLPTAEYCTNEVVGVLGQLNQPAHQATINSTKPTLLELYSDGQNTVIVGSQVP